jgi:hypothetical protein
LAFVAALLLWPAPAEAQYLDPGASSVIVQIVIAGLIGVAAVLKLYWHKLKVLISRKPPTGAQTDRQER